MPTLREVPLVDASVPRSAMFLDAARVLTDKAVSALAVLDEGRHVIGLFTDDDLLRGLFPRYLEQLRHTAFLDSEPEALEARLENAAAEPVTAHMRDPVAVDVDTSLLHVAERFLHYEWGALAVVEEERYVGMVAQVEFCRAVMARRMGGG